jgi:Zn-dependent protease with chaperone function
LLFIPGSVLVYAPDIFSQDVLSELDLVYELESSKDTDFPFLATNSFFIITGVLGYFRGFHWLIMLSGFLCIGVGFAAWYRYDEIAASYMSFSYSQYIPTPTGEYFFFVLTSLTPIASIRFARILGETTELGEATEDVMSVVAVAASVFLVALILYFSASEERLLLKTFAHGGQRYVENRLIQIIFLSLSIAVSYAGVLAVTWLIQQTDSVGRMPITFPMAILIALPLLYFWIGALLQPLSLLIHLYKISANSYPATGPVAEMADTQVLISTNSIGPSSYSVGFKNRILIPEETLEMLDPAELQAVVAHEEAHTKIYSDALMSFLAPFIGLMLLLGQNIIFSFLDFRKREFRADKYAAKKAGSENLKSALQTFKEVEQDGSVKAAQSSMEFNPFTPFVPTRERLTGMISKRFSLFFGGFAVSKAHPTVENRIDQLDLPLR